MKVRLQIRVLFPICMFALAAMAMCLGGWILRQSVADYRIAGRVERAVDVSALLFTVTDRIASERPIVGNALLADRVAGQALQGEINTIRRATDLSIAQAEQRILAMSYPEAGAQLDILHKIHVALVVWRSLADDMLVHPKSEREPTIFEDFVGALNLVSEMLDTALDLSDIAASQQDGMTMDLIAVSRQIWSIRRLTFPRTAMLIAAVDQGVGLDPIQLEQLARLGGLMSARWSSVDGLAPRLASIPGLAEVLAAAHQAFDDQDQMHQMVIGAARNGGHYSIAAIDLDRRSKQTGPVLKEARDAAIFAARTRVAGNRQAATSRMAVSGFVVLLFMVSTIGVVGLLKWRIVSPVLALTKVIDRLARRDYDIEIPTRANTDEIGRMALAIETLRQGAIVAARTEAQIVHMARHDALTGLANRRLMHERMEQALALAARGQPCAVMCLDLDRFKAVNDTFGHPVGDLLLRAVADRLLACVREVDTVCRQGGDEFVVLLVGLEEPKHADHVAQRMVQAIDKPFDLDGQTVSVGTSIGIAIAPRDATSAVSLLQRADTALYRTKQEGKGSYRHFKPEMDAESQARVVLEQDLREALQTEAFELEYQPRYVLATGQLCGFEALLRWRHPERGVVGAGDFIPLAQETGLIVPIGAWVLRQACAEALNWPDTVALAVNLSAVQFKNRAIVEAVRQALKTSGLPAARLDLQITEAALVKNIEVTLALLQELRQLGAIISMDDFGTGYSSLSYLRSFSFDRIKINQSFVRDLSQREDARAIIRALVALGKSLGMKTLAEGVETPTELAYLRQEGCDEVQGYLFGHPISAGAAHHLAWEIAAVLCPPTEGEDNAGRQVAYQGMNDTDMCC